MLELGCGVGLVSAVAAAVGLEVTASDYYPEVLEFAALNASCNGWPLACVRTVDWRELPADLGGFEIVAASDVLYEPRYAELVAAAFAATLAPRGLGMLADPQRQHAAGFPEACRRHGLEIVRRDEVRIAHDSSRQTIDIYELARPSTSQPEA